MALPLNAAFKTVSKTSLPFVLCVLCTAGWCFGLVRGALSGDLNNGHDILAATTAHSNLKPAATRRLTQTGWERIGDLPMDEESVTCQITEGSLWALSRGSSLAASLPLASATTAGWSTSQLPFAPGSSPTSAVVNGILQVVTYDINNPGDADPQYLLVKSPAPNNTWTAIQLDANTVGGSLGSLGGMSGTMVVDDQQVLVHCGGWNAFIDDETSDCFTLQAGSAGGVVV